MTWESEIIDNMSVSAWIPFDCDEPCLQMLDPPPDSILVIPPPPLPANMLSRSSIMDLTNGTCGHACLLATLEESGFIEVTRKVHPMLEDVWSMLIVSTSIGVILLSILLILIILRCREPKVKPVLDECIKPERPTTPAEVAVYARIDPLPQPPRVLWTGIRLGDPNLYSLEHRAVPDLLGSYEYVDYGAIGHTKIAMDAARADYAVPEGSFENSGYVDSDDPSRTSTPIPRVRRVAPDGAVLSSFCGPSPIYVGGKDIEILRARFNHSLHEGPICIAPPLPPPRPPNTASPLV